jgi:hypothetical protein
MPSPPDWLSHLADRVAEQFHATDVLSPLGCHFYHNLALDQWEVTLFASKTEIVGGKLDGVATTSNFSLDLKETFQVFDEVTNFHWQTASLGPDDDLGPHVSVEGLFEGNSVWVRVLSNPPAQFDTGRTLNAYSLRLEDVW